MSNKKAKRFPKIFQYGIIIIIAVGISISAFAKKGGTAVRLQDTPTIKRLEHVTTKLEKLIEEINDRSIGLRQAINPDNPEEILTIARLNDKVKDLEEKLKSSENRNKENIEAFKKSVTIRIDDLNNIKYLFIGGLVTLIVSLVVGFVTFILTTRNDKLVKKEEKVSEK